MISENLHLLLLPAPKHVPWPHTSDDKIKKLSNFFRGNHWWVQMGVAPLFYMFNIFTYFFENFIHIYTVFSSNPLPPFISPWSLQCVHLTTTGSLPPPLSFFLWPTEVLPTSTWVGHPLQHELLTTFPKKNGSPSPNSYQLSRVP